VSITKRIPRVLLLQLFSLAARSLRVSGRVSCQGSNSASTACGFSLDSSPAQTHTRHSPGNIGNAGNLDAPMGLHAVNVETARPRSTGCDHRVVKDGFDNCSLTLQI
jgi:hypothetical protein